ncbi:MAG: hypothetical protein IID42_13385 [Planctomycetes bacterium]|nr:hypothetical protein [Planctomycetota bacterium]
MGPYTGKETGETALLRQLLSGFESGDILLGDRYYCSYFVTHQPCAMRRAAGEC